MISGPAAIEDTAKAISNMPLPSSWNSRSPAERLLSAGQTSGLACQRLQAAGPVSKARVRAMLRQATSRAPADFATLRAAQTAHTTAPSGES